MLDVNEYVQKCKDKWGADFNYTYDLEELARVRQCDQITINCSEHGAFKQTGLLHLRYGCPACKKKWKNIKPHLYASKKELEAMANHANVKNITSSIGYKIAKVINTPEILNGSLTLKAEKINEYITNHPEAFPFNFEIERLKEQLSKSQQNVTYYKNKSKDFEDTLKPIENVGMTKAEYIKELTRLTTENNNASAAKLLADVLGFFDKSSDVVIRLVEFDKLISKGRKKEATNYKIQPDDDEDEED